MYVDVFVMAIKKENLERYRPMAELAGKVWREHGCLDYREWIEDDVPEGKLTSFPMAVKREPGELVMFSYVLYPSREARDACVAAVMEDPRMQDEGEERPFDGKRMIWGGFAPFIVK